jgi:hypothetical protein
VLAVNRGNLPKTYIIEKRAVIKFLPARVMEKRGDENWGSRFLS